MKPDEVERALRRLFAAQAHGAVCAYLFGSRARGDARASSDVDVAVLFEQEPQPTLEGLPLDLEARLERHLGLPVQVVALNGAPAELVHHVLRDGVLILDRDPSRRIRFTIHRRNEYFDLLPILREYRSRVGRAAESRESP